MNISAVKSYEATSSQGEAFYFNTNLAIGEHLRNKSLIIAGHRVRPNYQQDVTIYLGTHTADGDNIQLIIDNQESKLGGIELNQTSINDYGIWSKFNSKEGINLQWEESHSEFEIIRYMPVYLFSGEHIYTNESNYEEWYNLFHHEDEQGKISHITNINNNDPFMEELESFYELGENWDGDGANTIPHKAIELAKNFLEAILNNALIKPKSVAASPEGEVLIYWRIGSEYVEANFFGDGACIVCFGSEGEMIAVEDETITNIQESQTFREIAKKLQKLATK